MKRTVKCSGCGKEHEIEVVQDAFDRRDHFHITFNPVEGIEERVIALCDSFRSVHPYRATTLLLGGKQWGELSFYAPGLHSGSLIMGMTAYKVDVLDHMEVR
jgi:hypothetical protein